jgi:hypothetical protein
MFAPSTAECRPPLPSDRPNSPHRLTTADNYSSGGSTASRFRKNAARRQVRTDHYSRESAEAATWRTATSTPTTMVRRVRCPRDRGVAMRRLAVRRGLPLATAAGWTARARGHSLIYVTRESRPPIRPIGLGLKQVSTVPKRGEAAYLRDARQGGHLWPPGNQTRHRWQARAAPACPGSRRYGAGSIPTRS